MDQETSTTDEFEAQLEHGRGALAESRDAYSTLELTQTIPDSILGSIGDLEQELDELDQTLEVTAADVRLAKQTARRVSILADVFFVLQNRQRRVVEEDLTRVQAYASAITDLSRDAEPSDDFESRFDRLNRQLSMLQKLADSGRYDQVVSNNRVSPGKIDADLRNLESELAEEISDETHTNVYLTTTQNLLEDIYETLSELNDANDDKTAFSTDLNEVRNRIEDAESALEDDAPGRAVAHARIALEGAFMLHHSIARAGAEQQVAEELAGIIEGADGAVDCDFEQYASQGNADMLLTALADLISEEVERSTGDRLHQLLREHDGSVVRTAKATDFDVSTIVDQLGQLYQQQSISDIQVVFE